MAEIGGIPEFRFAALDTPTSNKIVMCRLFRTRGLVRVRAVIDRLDRQTVARRVVELTAVTLTLFVTGVAIGSFGAGVFRNYLRGYTSGTLADVPMWIPEGMVLFGLVVFWIQLLSLAVQLLRERAG